MAGMASRYYQVPPGLDDTAAVSSGRWSKSKVHCAFIIGSCFVVLSVVAVAGMFTTPYAASTVARSNLAGFTSSVRFSPLRGARPATDPVGPAILRSGMMSRPSGMEKLAIAAIKAVNQGSHMRDVSRKAAEDTMATLDNETKEEVAKVAKAVKVKAQDMVGVTSPMGFFDPLGLSTDLPTGRLFFYREVELKHGRVGMLAALGILVGEQFHPLFGGDIDLPAYITFQFTPLQTFWPAVVAAIAIPEVFSVFTFKPPEADEPWSMQTDRMPGDFGFDPLGLKPSDPEEFKAMQNKELNNGRLAMIAAAGMLAQELATNRKLFDAF